MSNQSNQPVVKQSGIDWKYLWKAAGPSVILAGVSLGPSSLVNAVNTGANFGYSLLWWLFICLMVFGVVFRVVMMHITVMTGKPFLHMVRDTYGPVWAMICGVLSCIQYIIFNIGNFVGGGLAMQLIFPGLSPIVGGIIVVVAAFFVLLMKNLYNKMEIWFKIMLLIMFIAFLIIALSSGHANPEAVPVTMFASMTPASSAMMMTLLGTNVSLATAAYSTSLIKEKGWKTEDIKKHGILADCLVGMAVMFLILLVLILAGARGFGGNPIVNGLQFGTALEETMGVWARYVIGIGFLSICFSTIIISPMVGIDVVLQALGKETGLSGTNYKTKLILTACMYVFCGIMGAIFGRAPAQLLLVSGWAGIICTPLFGIFAIILAGRKKTWEADPSCKPKIPVMTLLCITYAFLLVMTVINIINQFK